MNSKGGFTPLPGLRERKGDIILRVETLGKKFPSTRRLVGSGEGQTALTQLSFDVARGETFGLVGESGCGKSTAARCILGLVKPSAGRVVFDGVDLADLDRHELRKVRRNMQMAFQDSTASLDARMSALAIVEEPLVIHGLGTRLERRRRAEETLALLGIEPEQARRKPHEYSGGQRQRIGLARSIVLNPELLVLDEPVSAVDVSMQAQILNLLRELQDRLTLAYVFIVHDLAVAEHFCDRLAVLYLGSVMELSDRDSIFRAPLHPYTISLLSAVPIPSPALEDQRERIILRGEAAQDGQESETGCPFRPRCPVGHDRDICRSERPMLERKKADQWVACHFPGELSVGDVMPAAAVPA